MNNILFDIANQTPALFANITGSEKHPDIIGNANFFETPIGTIISIEVFGLPDEAKDGYNTSFFGFHIHADNRCGGEGFLDPVPANFGHYNPRGVTHPNHAGDLLLFFQETVTPTPPF